MTQRDRGPARAIAATAVSYRSVAFPLTACLSLTGLMILLAADAMAQTSRGGIRGFAKDGTGAVLVGVTVEASSPARIGSPAVEITDAQGLYNFENLPIGLYTLVYTLQGFGTVRREDLRVEAGRAIQVDVEMVVGALEQAITVRGESPVVDAAHAGTTTNFNRELIENIPSLRVHYFDVVAYAPAVRTVPGNASYSLIVFGSSGDQNAMRYDGIEISDPLLGGNWDYSSPDMIQEIEVKAIGAEAEFYGFQGGMINIVTKSGTNRLRGMGSFYTIPSALVGNNTPDETFPHRVEYDYQWTPEVGLPLVKDRLWTYAIVPFARTLEYFVGTDPSLTGVPGKGWKPFVKGTWRPSGEDLVDLVYASDNWAFPSYATRTSPIETQRSEHQVVPKLWGNWSRTIGSNTLFQVRAGHLQIRNDYGSSTGDFETSQHIDAATGIVSGNTDGATKFIQGRTTVDVGVSHSVSDFIKGSHDFKFGVQNMFSGERTHDLVFSNATYEDFAGAPSLATFREPAVVGSSFPSIGGYAQDVWTVNDRLTLNLGARFDHLNAGIPAMSSQTTFTSVVGTTFTIPTNTEFPAIPDLFSFNHSSARLGLTLRLDRAGRTIFKTHAGRYYGKVAGTNFNRVSPGSTPFDTRAWNPAAGRFDIPVSFIDTKLNLAVDPNLKNSYTDQFYIGLERQVMADMGVDVMFVYKNPKNFIRLKDTRGTYAPQQIVDTFRGVSQTLTVYNLAVPSSQRLFTVLNRNDLDHSFKSLVLQTYKRFSHRWQAQGSYTWQDSKGYATGGISSETFAGNSPTSAFGRTPNEMINAYGPMPTDSTNAVKLSMTYQAPLEFHFGVKYAYETGRPYGRLITVRGLSQGTVNVLAEPRGTYRLSANQDLSIRIDRDFRFTTNQRLRLSMDVHNLLNTGTVRTARNNSSQTGDAAFGQTLSVVRPRAAMLGVRYEF